MYAVCFCVYMNVRYVSVHSGIGAGGFLLQVYRGSIAPPPPQKSYKRPFLVLRSAFSRRKYAKI